MPGTPPARPAAVQELREYAARQGWSRWRLVQEICVRTGVRPLAAFRIAAGWTLREATRRLAELPDAAAQRDVSMPVLCAWEHGGASPSVTQVDLLCQL